MSDTETKKPEVPWLLLKPKISGQGTVFKKDGTVSKPEQPKEQENGRNTDNRSA